MYPNSVASQLKESGQSSQFSQLKTVNILNNYYDGNSHIDILIGQGDAVGVDVVGGLMPYSFQFYQNGNLLNSGVVVEPPGHIAYYMFYPTVAGKTYFSFIVHDSSGATATNYTIVNANYNSPAPIGSSNSTNLGTEPVITTNQTHESLETGQSSGQQNQVSSSVLSIIIPIIVILVIIICCALVASSRNRALTEAQREIEMQIDKALERGIVSKIQANTTSMVHGIVDEEMRKHGIEEISRLVEETPQARVETTKIRMEKTKVMSARQILEKIRDRLPEKEFAEYLFWHNKVGGEQSKEDFGKFTR